MTSSNPIITIGITAYNASDTIEKAVNSALLQEWDNKEIIIVDDFSTDATPDILKRKAESHSNIRFFRNEKNAGVAFSRNRIIQEAKGEFIAFFDDDDQSSPLRLSKQIERILIYETLYAKDAPVICYTARTQIYPDGYERYEPTTGMDIQDIAPHGEAVADYILIGKKSSGNFGSMATCSQMARTTTYRDNQGFDCDFRRSEDTEFNVRLGLKGVHFIGLQEPLVIQAMTLSSEKKLEEERLFFLKLLNKYQGFINQKSSYTACSQWAEAKYDFLMGRRFIFVQKIIKLFLAHPVFTLKRFFSALPNTGFNLKFSKFHQK